MAVRRACGQRTSHPACPHGGWGLCRNPCETRRGKHCPCGRQRSARTDEFKCGAAELTSAIGQSGFPPDFPPNSSLRGGKWREASALCSPRLARQSNTFAVAWEKAAADFRKKMHASGRTVRIWTRPIGRKRFLANFVRTSEVMRKALRRRRRFPAARTTMILAQGLRQKAKRSSVRGRWSIGGRTFDPNPTCERSTCAVRRPISVAPPCVCRRQCADPYPTDVRSIAFRSPLRSLPKWFDRNMCNFD